MHPTSRPRAPRRPNGRFRLLVVGAASIALTSIASASVGLTSITTASAAPVPGADAGPAHATAVPAAGLPAAGVPAAGRATAGSTAAGRADRAARWLATQVDAGTITTGGVPDPGLAADVALALTAAGRAEQAASLLADRLLTRPDDYVAPSGAGQVVAGAVAKLLVLARARNVDAAQVTNLRSQLLGTLVVEPGAAADGRFRDRPPTATPGLADRSNNFSQSLAVLGLARTGDVPAAAVAHLLAQQCPSGGFRLFLTGGRGCTLDSATDVDATAVAVLALGATQPPTGAPGADSMRRGLDRLEALQRADGAFTSSGPGATPNANSTGLAAHALRLGGRPAPAERAAAWLAALQLGCTPVAGDAGAVAFGTTAFSAAADGIPAQGRDQFRRATSQALLAFVEAPLGTAGAPAVGSASCPDEPVPTTAPPSTTTTVPSGGSTTTVPSGGSTTTVPSGGSTTAPTAPTDAPANPTAATEVLGAVESAAPPSSGQVRSSRTDGASLAATGTASRRIAPVALVLVVAGIGLLATTVRRRGAGR